MKTAPVWNLVLLKWARARFEWEGIETTNNGRGGGSERYLKAKRGDLRGCPKSKEDAPPKTEGSGSSNKAA